MKLPEREALPADTAPAAAPARAVRGTWSAGAVVTGPMRLSLMTEQILPLWHSRVCN
jgi:hypothetical protein